MTNWKDCEIHQLNGQAERIKHPAQSQVLTATWTDPWTEQWNQVAAIPNIAYIPEKDQVLLMVSCGNPHQAVTSTSDDYGATWSEPQYMHTDDHGKSDTGLAVGLVYAVAGQVLCWTLDYMAVPKQPWIRWSSEDYGQTWTKSSPIERNLYPWDRPTIERDAQTGKVTKIWETAYIEDHSRKIWSQAYLRSSEDQGRTWSDFREIPEWSATNEVCIVRAKNGTLVAAHRTDMPKRFVKRNPETGEEDALDLYEGLGISISRDEGQNWSTVEKLYDWGRHHFSLLTLENGDIVMSYTSRMGYVETADGHPQFGVEAVVSHDHGQTWDLDHRYIFAAWPGNRSDKWLWNRCSQATSSVLLPDGSILTAFGTGYRAEVIAGDESAYCPRDVGLVKWRINDEDLNDDTSIADAPFDSDLRNRFDPQWNTFA
ncbi:MAG TPA: exo-alpha-sialidase [Candidatus Handelsmanbacteria bacterium]|nr:exo-alpha-sialidase [Candidatus Handelsmanbacteria bacterium]